MPYDSYSGLDLGDDYMSDNYLLNHGYIYEGNKQTSHNTIKKHFYKNVSDNIGHKYTIFIEKDIYESSEEYAENYYFSARFNTSNFHQFFSVDVWNFTLPYAEEFFEQIWCLHNCVYMEVNNES